MMVTKVVFNHVLGAAVICIGMAACSVRLAPILNIKDAGFQTGPEKKLTLEQVGEGISKAALKKRWTTSIKKPGHIIAILRNRHHIAEVDINFTTQKYSIVYKDSQALNYADGRIHRSYNRWIRNLELEIQKALLYYQ